MTAVRILQDSTDTLTVYPPRQHLGVPTAAFFRVATINSAPPAAPGDPATIDAVSAATDAEADRGSSQLSFAADPGVTPGRRYMLTLPDGERFQVEAQLTGAIVELADPLPRTAPVGTTISGIAMSLALTANQTAERGRGLVKVTATIDGIERKWDRQFRVVREEFAQLLSVAELLEMHPDMIRLKDPADGTLGEAIDSAWDHELLRELEARGILIDRINSPDRLNSALGACIRWRAIARQRGDDSAQAIAAKERYDEVLRSTLDGRDFWYDEGDDDSNPGDERGKERFQYPRYSR